MLFRSIDSRALDRDCLAKALLQHDLGMEVSALASVEEWRKQKDLHPPLAAILLNLGGKKVTDANVAGEISRLAAEFRSIPVVILADTDELKQIMKALECGARGFIPTTVGVDVCVEAIGLAIALKKKLGFRYLLDFIPLDAGLVKGSHGRASHQPDAAPLLISQQQQLLPDTALAAPDVFQIIMAHLDLK